MAVLRNGRYKSSHNTARLPAIHISIATSLSRSVEEESFANQISEDKSHSNRHAKLQASLTISRKPHCSRIIVNDIPTTSIKSRPTIYTTNLASTWKSDHAIHASAKYAGKSHVLSLQKKPLTTPTGGHARISKPLLEACHALLGAAAMHILTSRDHL